MNRRTFLTTTAPPSRRSGARTSGTTRISKFANTKPPVVARTTAGLEPYAGPWGFDQVAHLLRRAMFGAVRNDISLALPLTMAQLVAQLLADAPAPNPPVNVDSQDTGVPLGQTWVTAPKLDAGTPPYNPNSTRISSLKAWWIGLMIGQPVSLREKMTLFWQNHFVSEAAVVGDARYCYKQNALFRQYALGNFRDLAKQVTIDPAMLVYLNGNTNTSTSPNENYARELQELFTIGKGPEIAPGNYTNYTEADVQAAARVLTGWRDDSTNITSYFTASRHDPTNKQFSSAYGGTVITGQTGSAGANEVDDLLNMIFAQAETARFLCRKLYRWFVYYLIDDTTETNVIGPMADIFRNNNYEIKPVLQALFSSAHFYDPVNIGCIIKNPIDHLVGMCRQMAIAFPASTDYPDQYAMWNYVRQQSANMQQDLCDPPNVAGWPAYYQAPQFHELWINSDTLPKRNRFTDNLNTSGYTKNTASIVVDPIAFAKQTSDPSDPNIIVQEFAQYLFPIQITTNQNAYLHDILIPGLPDYEWTNEWNAYTSDPTNQAKLVSVKSKLQALLSFIMDMAEYELM